MAVLMFFLAVLLLYPRCAKHSSSSPEPLFPIRKVVDLDIGEKTEVELADGSRVAVRLIGMEHERDHLRNAVRSARVRIEVNGREAEINSANYCLPDLVAGVRIDCPITRDYYTNTDQDRWGLDKAARLRIWPGEGPFIKPETFLYPVGQRILASDTQMSNEPCYVDGGEIPGDKNIYYHSGLDFGGSEGMVEVFAATDGLVVSARDSVLEAHKKGTPVMPRYDVVYVLDERGWYYRYSHMQSIEPWVVPESRWRRAKRSEY